MQIVGIQTVIADSAPASALSAVQKSMIEDLVSDYPDATNEKWAAEFSQDGYRYEDENTGKVGTVLDVPCWVYIVTCVNSSS